MLYEDTCFCPFGPRGIIEGEHTLTGRAAGSAGDNLDDAFRTVQRRGPDLA